MSERPSHRRSSRLIETLILLALPFLLHALFPIRTIITAPYRYAGIVVMLVGLWIANQARQYFMEAGTTFQLEGASQTLVTDGPFRHSRNPIYLGMLLWLLGLAIVLGSLGAFILPTVVFLLMNFVMIPMEETRMEEVGGEAYLAYRSRVRRWF